MNKRKRYIKGDNIEWTAEINCIKVLNKDIEKMITIPYPGAAVWDLLQQNYTAGQIIPVLSAITGKNKSEVEKLIEKNIQRWIEEGLIK